MREEIEILKDDADAHPDAVDEIVLLRGRQLPRRRPVQLDVADPDLPSSNRSRRFKHRSMVDLPQPDGPRMVVSCPSAIWNVALFSTDNAP